MYNLNLNRLIEIRHKIHQFPELSGQESKTAERIADQLRSIGLKDLKTGIAGNGILAVISGSKSGKNILFRCELDALPLKEENEIPYRSKINGRAHLCGHDGHMTILLGLAERLLSKKDRIRGKVILLFQPAEETAQGAFRVIEDPEFKKLQVDQAIALHNIPGYPAGSILLRKGAFASASRGMIIKLLGKTSHAGEPQNGRPPTRAMTGIINDLSKIPDKTNSFKDKVLNTVIYARLGEIAFGTSPGYAEIMATLRSRTAADMKNLIEESEKIVQLHTEQIDLRSTLNYTEIFPASINDEELVTKVNKAAAKLERKVFWLKEPFSWSEDFGYFSQEIPSVLFGLGSGADQPKLHNPEYNFPDEIIASGIDILDKTYEEVK